MSNIIDFKPRRRASRSDNITSLLQGISARRRHPTDVIWLKENSELLCTLAATNTAIGREALEPYVRFYDELEERLRFYPQYYRFFVSMCLDLEDLGMPGRKGQSICDWVAASGLAEAELSDLQRAEAQRLLARRGRADAPDKGTLGERLRRFVERPETFALPNRKAAYELTHIVFYLSEYGRRDPVLSNEALKSLEFTGLVAFLDQNHDLLAEICTAMRFAGQRPSPVWEDAVADAHAAIIPMAASDGAAKIDGYHAYLVTGWAQMVAGRPYFEAEVPPGGIEFVDRARPQSALRGLSECLYALGKDRSSDWEGMRGRVVPQLDTRSQTVLKRAEASSALFGSFFEGFARASGM